MTQSKNKDDNTFIINLDNTYGTTTSYSSGNTITITGPTVNTDYTFNNMHSEYNIGGISGVDISTISIDDVTTFNWHSPTVALWEDELPDLSRVKKMCKHYPALEKAYENFKSIYKMVEQDYKGNHEDKDD